MSPTALSPLDPAMYASIVTQRTGSLVAEDLETWSNRLVESIQGRRVLIVGGAGSIGAATTALIARYKPAALHVVDQDENALVELVRTLRGGELGQELQDFRTWPLDCGSREMRLHLLAEPPYDAVLNLAAVKHVRSEKDSVTALHLVNTNVLKPIRIAQWLSERGGAGSYFAVSTDKAAEPASVMGASKRLMELVVLGPGPFESAARVRTSARFANVAFSRGSLLEGFLYRIAKRQPLTCPATARRYFISLAESAEICVLASFCAESRTIVVPRAGLLQPVFLKDVIDRLLGHFDLVPIEYSDQEAARASVERDLGRGRYPVVLTPLDTQGEKADEVFIAPGETVEDERFRALWTVDPVVVDEEALHRCLALLDRYRHHDGIVDKRAIVEALGGVVPGFQHKDSPRHLDMSA